MATHHHQVSDVKILQVNDHSNMMKKNKISFPKIAIIELNEDDDDCVVFVKKEKNLLVPTKGNDIKDPICVDDEYCKKTPILENNNKKNVLMMGVDDIQYVDDYDDEIRIPSVIPSSSSSPRKRRKPFSSFSVTEKGESSGSKYVENVDEVVEIEPLEEEVVMFTCEICADTKPSKENFKIKGCSHSYCYDCMTSYVASKLQEGVPRVNCPVPGCPGVLEPEYCRDILPPEVFDRWGKLLCESVIIASQKFYCPFKDCSALLIDDGGETVTQSECPSCFRLFCAQCKVAWHDGIACAEYQKLSKDERKKEDIMLRNLAKSQNWQRCPTCKFYVEKSEGCLYMKCRCGVAFCYKCGAIHTDHRYHYCAKCGR